GAKRDAPLFAQPTVPPRLTPWAGTSYPHTLLPHTYLREYFMRAPTPAVVMLAALAASAHHSVAPVNAANPPEPMTFEWVQEGPPHTCKGTCREWVQASGLVTEGTPQRFADFSRAKDVRGATLVLDSPGGHVLAGIWLGREFRRLGMATTVGRALPFPSNQSSQRTLSSHAQCASMCPFILLGGVLRQVPTEARILVHQIWPSQQLEDAMAATYSGLQMVSEQRQLGQLARYTIEMGGDIALFEAAMRIPPWELLRPLTAEEVRRAGLHNAEDVFDKVSIKTAASKSEERASPVFLGVELIGNLSPSTWQVVEHEGVKILTREHPLTARGEEIGHFRVSFACGGNNLFKVTYRETRQIPENSAMLVRGVGLGVDAIETGVMLHVETSLRDMHAPTIETIASGSAPIAFVTELFRDGGQRLVVATMNTNKEQTSVSVGKAGLDSLGQFALTCQERLPSQQ